MANQIDKNSWDRAILHLDTNDGEITLAELKHADEATVTGARIVEIFYNIPATGTVVIDRGGTDAIKLIGNASGASNLIGHINYRNSGVALRGSDAADIGVTFTNFTNGLITLVVHKTH